MLENVHVGEPFHWVKLPKRALYSSTFMFTRNGVNHLGFTFNPCQMLLSIKSQTISLISFLWKNETYPQNTNSYVGHWIWWFLIHYIISKKWFVGGVKMSNFDWTCGRISLFDFLEDMSSIRQRKRYLSFYRGRLVVAQDSSRLATGITETVGSIMWVDLLGWGWWKISWRILSFESFAVFSLERTHFERKERDKDWACPFFWWFDGTDSGMHFFVWEFLQIF